MNPCTQIWLKEALLSIPLYGFQPQREEWHPGKDRYKSFQFHCMDSRAPLRRDNRYWRWVAFNSIVWIRGCLYIRPVYAEYIAFNSIVWIPTWTPAVSTHPWPGLSIPSYGFVDVPEGGAYVCENTYFQFHCMDSQVEKSLRLSGELVGFQFHCMDSPVDLSADDAVEFIFNFQFHCMDSAPSRFMFTMEISLISITRILFH